MAIQVRVVLDKKEIERYGSASAMGAVLLKPHAERILERARSRAPSWLDARWWVKAGKGPAGAFAQAIATGSGAVLAEYGGTKSRAYAMFRNAVR